MAFSFYCISHAVGTSRMPKSTRRQNRENGHIDTHRTTTVTLAVHARQGLINNKHMIFGTSLSEPHTSLIALHVHVYVCLLACLLVAIYRKFELNKRMFKFAHVLKPNSCSVNELHTDRSTTTRKDCGQ